MENTTAINTNENVNVNNETVNTDIQVSDIFKKGVLIQLTIGCWNGATKISKKKLKEVFGSDWTKAEKELINPKEIKAMVKLGSEARQGFLYKRTVPFPIKGAVICSFEALEAIDRGLQERQDYYMQKVNDFVSRYPQLKEEARQELEPHDLYNEEDYPTNILDKFYFTWRYFNISSPDNDQMISPDIIRREREKFIATMEEAREEGVKALRLEFSKLVQTSISQLTPKPDGSRKKIYDSMTGNFYEFFETFKTRNIFNDETLNGLLDQARGIIAGVTTNDLKESEDLRKVVQENMNSLSNQLDSCMTDAPSRKLKLN